MELKLLILTASTPFGSSHKHALGSFKFLNHGLGNLIINIAWCCHPSNGLICSVYAVAIEKQLACKLHVSLGDLSFTSLNIGVWSLHCNGNFPGGPGLAGTRMSPFRILLELSLMEVVVTVGAIRRAKLQNVTTNKPTPNFLQARCPSCRPTNSVKARKWKYSGGISLCQCLPAALQSIVSRLLTYCMFRPT